MPQQDVRRRHHLHRLPLPVGRPDAPGQVRQDGAQVFPNARPVLLTPQQYEALANRGLRLAAQIKPALPVLFSQGSNRGDWAGWLFVRVALERVALVCPASLIAGLDFQPEAHKHVLHWGARREAPFNHFTVSHIRAAPPLSAVYLAGEENGLHGVHRRPPRHVDLAQHWEAAVVYDAGEHGMHSVLAKPCTAHVQRERLRHGRHARRCRCPIALVSGDLKCRANLL
mmetsp:Transcript_18222/g.58218  ORF Transcript_18222/g.58218 Transcript_18222/m.58218 type:complete len:227 (+) Transcript_18222:756-1436(+)